MVKTLNIDIVDAFTSTQFKGNSAAVVLLEDWLPASLMQSIAMENNLSETAFIVKREDGKFAIRWFSPIAEIDFCGHATLASAAIIFREYPALNTITFNAKAVGDMMVKQVEQGFIQMNFPIRAPTLLSSVPDALLKGLSIAPQEILLNDQAYFAIYNNAQDVFDVVQNDTYLKQLAPRDVVVTAPAKDYDFVSRYFWPANGNSEDPVTGSIHTGLAPYWGQKLNKNTLIAYQASARGGVLKCEIVGDRVNISGQTVPYLKGVVTLSK